MTSSSELKCVYVALHLVMWDFKFACADPRNEISSLDGGISEVTEKPFYFTVVS